jgi:hypothetical protein
MALSAGTVTVDEDGAATGTGLAFAIFEGALADVDEDARSKVAASMKPFCEGLAAAIVNHFKDNGLIVVSVSAGGLQRTPSPNDPNTATLAPSSPVELSGTIE